MSKAVISSIASEYGIHMLLDFLVYHQVQVI
jgi:hypothetical protein